MRTYSLAVDPNRHELLTRMISGSGTGMRNAGVALLLALAVITGAGCSRAGHAGRTAGPGSAAAALPRRPGRAVGDIALAGPKLAFAVGVRGLETSADGGESWARARGAPGSYYQLDVVSRRVIFAAGRGQMVARTVDGGRSWHSFRVPAGAGGRVGFWSAQAGVAADPASEQYVVTRDGGRDWRPLRLPSWSLGKGGLPAQDGDRVQSSLCLAPGGTSWAVASRAGHRSVLVSADAGRRWQVALPWRKLPQASGVAVAGCTGNAVWVTVSRADRYGEPVALDLLHTADRGQSWLDVLRWAYHGVPLPAVPSPPGGPRLLPGPLGPYIDWLSAPAPGAAWIALTDGKGGETGFGETGDGGMSWHFWSFPGNPNTSGVPAAATLPASLVLLTLTAADARHAWMLFDAPVHNGRCWLYGTADGGATWNKITIFRTGQPDRQATGA